MDNKTGSNHGHKEVRKCKKTENIGNIIKTWSPFLARYGPPRTQQWFKNGHFSQRIVFYTFPGICRRFRPEVLSQTPKNGLFGPRSHSKGPNHALEKVLTMRHTRWCVRIVHGQRTFYAGEEATSRKRNLLCDRTPEHKIDSGTSSHMICRRLGHRVRGVSRV